jgi:hypothetical protein
MVEYKYNTYADAKTALDTVNAYFELPCGDDCLTWTEIQEGEGYWFLSADRLNEILGE